MTGRYQDARAVQLQLLAYVGEIEREQDVRRECRHEADGSVCARCEREVGDGDE